MPRPAGPGSAAGGLLCLALLLPPGAGAATLEVRTGEAAGGTVQVVDGERPWRAEASVRHGRAVFADVEEGVYSVVVEVGAETATLSGVRLRAREHLTVELADGVLHERSRAQEAYGTTFDEEDLVRLPSSRDAFSLLETAEPLAISDRLDTGGLYAGEPGRASIHGSSWTQTGYRLGPLDAADPLGTGAPLLFPDVRPFSSMDVISSALPVSVRGPGPLVSFDVQRPERAWHGVVEVTASFGEDGGDAPAGAPPPVSRLDRWRDGYAEAGGPLVEDALGIFVAGGITRAERFDRASPVAVDSERRHLLGQLVYTPAAGTEARLLALRHELDPPAGDSRFTLVQAQVERRWPSGQVLGAAAGHQRASFETEGAPASFRTVERLLDGPVPEQGLPGEEERRHTTLAGWWARGVGRRHLLRVGIDAFWQEARATPLAGPHLTAELLDGRPAHLWEAIVPGATLWSARMVAVHASDRFTAGRLALDGGLRLEWLGGDGRGPVEDVDWTSLSPAVQARFALLPDDRLAFRAAFSIRRQRLLLSHMGFGDLAAPRYDVYRWDDDGDAVFSPGERGALVTRFGPGAPVVARDPGLDRPRTREWLAGFEARLSPSLVLRFFGVDRAERDLLETAETALSTQAYTVVHVPDAAGDIVGPEDDQLLPIFVRRPASFGRDRLLLTNPQAHTTRHQGLELWLEWRAPRGMLLFGATAHRSEGNAAWIGFRPEENDQGLIGDLFDDPNADTFSRGRLFSDRAYTIKIAGWHELPWDVTLGAVARYQDGQNFARLVLADLPQGWEAVRAVPNGRHRFSYTLTVDARLEKAVRLGRARVAVVAEAFNLLQTDHETEEYVVTGPAFRTPTFRQPPRVVKAGLRVGF